jgi:hypothetical protein
MPHPRGRHLLRLKGPQLQNLSGFSPLAYEVLEALGHEIYQNKCSSEVEPSTGPNFSKAEAEVFTEHKAPGKFLYFKNPHDTLWIQVLGERTNLRVSKNKMPAGLDITFFKNVCPLQRKIPCSKPPSNYTTKSRPTLYEGESEPAYGMPREHMRGLLGECGRIPGQTIGMGGRSYKN